MPLPPVPLSASPPVAFVMVAFSMESLPSLKMPLPPVPSMLVALPPVAFVMAALSEMVSELTP